MRKHVFNHDFFARAFGARKQVGSEGLFFLGAFDRLPSAMCNIIFLN